MCQTARKYSTISIPGVYGSAYDKFPLGQLFQRELQIRMGQCPVKKYNEQLLHLIEVGRIDVTKIISHSMKLDEAPKGYEMFDKKEEVTKVVFKPWKVKRASHSGAGIANRSENSWGVFRHQKKFLSVGCLEKWP